MNMTSEYMCRAKRMSDDQWICGHYIGTTLGSAYFAVQNNNLGQWTTQSVDPDTVCRSIGRKDKNGTMIFEHDYVRTEHGRICEVLWFSSTMHCGWDFMPVAKFNCPPPHGYYLWSADNLEIVGNKFDNAEIAEVLT